MDISSYIYIKIYNVQYYINPDVQSQTAVMLTRTITGDSTRLTFPKVKINVHNYLLFYYFGLVLQNILLDA